LIQGAFSVEGRVQVGSGWKENLLTGVDRAVFGGEYPSSLN
jgi:hypothetical protein